MELKDFVFACRTLKGMTQEEFAPKIGLVSKRSAQSVANYEKGTDKPSFAVLERMAKLVGLELKDCIVFWDPEKKQPREAENREAKILLDRFLESPERDKVIAFLRSLVPSGAGRPNKSPRPHRKGRIVDSSGQIEK